MTTNSRRLYRSKTDSMLAGVAGGMAEYFDIDPTLTRMAWVVLGLASAGTALIAYIVMAIIVPERKSAPSQSSGATDASIDDLPKYSPRVGGTRRWTARRNLFGVALVALGALFLLSNLGFFFWWRWDIFWPLAIIAIGVALILGRFTGGSDE